MFTKCGRSHPFCHITARPLACLELSHSGQSVHARPVEALTCRFDSRGCPVHRHSRPRPCRRSGSYLFDQAAAARAGVERLPRAKNEIWYQGSETPSSGRRMTMVLIGRLPEACSSTPQPLRHPQPCVPCGRRPYNDDPLRQPAQGHTHAPTLRRDGKSHK